MADANPGEQRWGRSPLDFRREQLEKAARRAHFKKSYLKIANKMRPGAIFKNSYNFS